AMAGGVRGGGGRRGWRGGGQLLDKITEHQPEGGPGELPGMPPADDGPGGGDPGGSGGGDLPFGQRHVLAVRGAGQEPSREVVVAVGGEEVGGVVGGHGGPVTAVEPGQRVGLGAEVGGPVAGDVDEGSVDVGVAEGEFEGAGAALGEPGDGPAVVIRGHTE